MTAFEQMVYQGDLFFSSGNYTIARHYYQQSRLRPRCRQAQYTREYVLSQIKQCDEKLDQAPD